MKRVVIAVAALVVLTSGALFAEAQTTKKHTKLRPKIALMLDGKAVKEIVPTKEVERPGIGTDYTFEWSGGRGDMFVEF